MADMLPLNEEVLKINQLWIQTDVYREKTIADCVTRDNVLFSLLKQKNKFEKVTGLEVIMPIRVPDYSNIQKVVGLQQIKFSQRKTLGAYSYRLHTFANTDIIPNIELQQNMGSSKIIDILTEARDSMEEEAANYMAASFWSKGIFPDTPHGIPHIISDYPDQTTVGGMSGKNPYTRNVAIKSDVPLTVDNIKSFLDMGYDKVRRNGGGKGDWVMGNTLWHMYEDHCMKFKINQEKTGIGTYDALAYRNGSMVINDSGFQGMEGEILEKGGCPEDHAYWIPWDAFQVGLFRELEFEPWRLEADRDGVATRCMTDFALMCNNRAFCAVVFDGTV